MWSSLKGQDSAGFIKFSCVTQQKAENAGLHHIQENKFISNITVIDVGVYEISTTELYTLLFSDKTV